jgi:hypothetical protein
MVVELGSMYIVSSCVRNGAYACANTEALVAEQAERDRSRLPEPGVRRE